jgi:peptidoglycan/xylan/chitin deacetylase (PgdA/CDA1 family)
VIVLLAGLITVFIVETLPYTVPSNPAPAVRLSAEDSQLAQAFPDYGHGIPVINYQDISAHRGIYSVTSTAFAQQLATLKQAGFHSVRLRQVVDLVSGRGPRLPPRPLLITFDGGIASAYVNADAILARYGFTAVIFAPTSHLATKTPSYYLTRDELKHLVSTGRWEVGSYTDSGHQVIRTAVDASGPWLTNVELHPDGSWESLDGWRQRVAADLDRSVDEISDLQGRRPVALAYPFLASSPAPNRRALPPLLDQLVAQRFALAFTADVTPSSSVTATSPRWRLPRLQVINTMSVAALLGALSRMVPQMPTPFPDQWRLAPLTGGCRVSAHSVMVSSSGYARCPARINGAAWTDYTVRADVAGVSRTATAIVTVRDQGLARFEVAASDARLTVREFLPNNRWQQLRAVPLPPHLVGARHRLVVTVQRNTFSVTVDGIPITSGTTDPAMTWGVPGFGLAARGHHEVFFHNVRATTPVAGGTTG